MKISWTMMVTWSLPLLLTACNYPGASHETVQARPQAAKAPAPAANQQMPIPSTQTPAPKPVPAANGSVTPSKPAAPSAPPQPSAKSAQSSGCAAPTANAAPAVASDSGSETDEKTLSQSLSLLNPKNLAKQDAPNGKVVAKGDETLKITFNEDVTIPGVHKTPDNDAPSDSDTSVQAQLQRGKWYASAPKDNDFSCTATYSFDSKDESLVIRKGTVYTFQRTAGSIDSDRISQVTLTADRDGNESSISTLECDGNGGTLLVRDLVEAFAVDQPNTITVSTSSNGLWSRIKGHL